MVEAIAPSAPTIREPTTSNSKPFVCWPVSLQLPGRPITLDRTRTALAAAAYIRRDRFQRSNGEVIDFTKRGADLVARVAIHPPNSTGWVQSPYLRWALADEASDRTGKPDDIRAWHVVADLPASASSGECLDGVTELVSMSLTPTAVADIAIHKPDDGVPAHAHIVAASRIPGTRSYLGVDWDLHFALNVALRLAWYEWVADP